MSFFEVEDVRFLPGDRFAVANRGTEEIRVFDRSGAAIGVIGRPGRGPEEFSGLSWIAPRGDSIYAWDFGNDRIAVRGIDGTLVRSFRLEWLGGGLVPVAMFPNGSILTNTVRRLGETTGAGTFVDDALVSRYGSDGTLVDSLGRFPWATRVVHREGGVYTVVRMPIDAPAAFVTLADGFCTVFGPTFEIRCHDLQGRAHTFLRTSEPPRPVDQLDATRYFDRTVEEALDANNEASAQALRRARPTMVFPPFLPGYERLLSDENGRLWAKVFGEPGATVADWHVFAEGRWIARLSLDADFEPTDIDGDDVIGIYRDEVGVESIRIYALAEPR